MQIMTNDSPISSTSNGATFIRTAPDHLQKFSIRESEKRIQAQVQLMLAADQRALVVAGFGATIAALGLGALVTSNDLNALNYLPYAAVCMGFAALIGAYLCWQAASPREIHPAGWDISDLKSDAESEIEEGSFLIEVVICYQQRIELNEGIMIQNNQQFRIGSAITFLSPLIGALFGVVPWQTAALFF